MTTPAVDMSSSPPEFGQIILFGDSLAEMSFKTPGGLGLELMKLYDRRMDVINRGVSGYNTSWALELAPRFFPSATTTSKTFKQSLAIIWFGANDSTLPHSPQSIPVSLFKENIIAIMNVITLHSPTTKFLLLTCPPVDLAKWGVELLSKEPGGRAMDREESRTREFADAVLEVATQIGVPSIDVHEAIAKEAEGQQVGVGEFLSDGLHLSGAGYAIVLRALKAKIKESLPSLAPEAIPDVFPDFKEVIEKKFGPKDATVA